MAQTAGSLSGTVKTAAGVPVQRAEVQIVDLRRTTTTDATGAYRFENVPAGGHLVQVASSREVTYVEEKGKACSSHTHRRNHTVAADRWTAPPIAITSKAS